MPEYHEANIRKTIRRLVNAGYIKKVRGPRTEQPYKLTENGSIIWGEIMTPIEQAIESSGAMHYILNKGKLFFDKNPGKLSKYILKAIQLYNLTSPYLNQKTEEENFMKIIQTLNENPGMGFKDLSKETRISRMSYYLKILRDKGWIHRVKKVGMEVPYYTTTEGVKAITKES